MEVLSSCFEPSQSTRSDCIRIINWSGCFSFSVLYLFIHIQFVYVFLWTNFGLLPVGFLYRTLQLTHLRSKWDYYYYLMIHYMKTIIKKLACCLLHKTLGVITWNISTNKTILLHNNFIIWLIRYGKKDIIYLLKR